MNMGEAIQSVFSKYATFSGRARRSEFWYFFLFNLCVGIVIGIVDTVIGSPILGYVVDLAFLIPSLAVACRRLHDTDRTGWWLFMLFLPIIGWILLIVWYCQDTQPADNRYGPSPKGATGQQNYGGESGYGYTNPPYST